MLREQERTGRIFFSAFYKPHVKLILHASTLVLLVTVAASFLTYNQSRFISVAWDAVWALFFSGNLALCGCGNGLLLAGRPGFSAAALLVVGGGREVYFVWPLVMLLICAHGPPLHNGNGAENRRGRSNYRHLRRILLLDRAGNRGIFDSRLLSTLSRARELGIGALLAVVAPVLVWISAALRPGLAWAGAAGMLASLFIINESSQFPAPSAALPVFAAALFILAGTGSSELKFLSPFTNRVSGCLGNISYSLYLWHFPAIMIVSAFMGESPLYYLVAGLGLLVFAAYSYHLVEDLIRKSNWLAPRKPRGNAHACQSPTS